MSGVWIPLVAKFVGRCPCGQTWTTGQRYVWHTGKQRGVRCLTCYLATQPASDLHQIEPGPATAVLSADGGCFANGYPQWAVMICVVTDDQGRVLLVRTAPGGTNNQAELWAIVEAAERAAADGLRRRSSAANDEPIDPLADLRQLLRSELLRCR